MTKERKKRLIIWSLLLVFLSFVGYVVYSYGIDYYKTYYACNGVKINYYEYPVQGIDVSAHQGSINWKNVADNDILFAFIKATEGTNFADKTFKTNLNSAKANGILVGAYHFFRFNKEGKAQAEWFIANVKPEMINFPPVVDIELSYGNILSSFNNNKVQSEIFNYLRIIEKFYKQKPIIYTNNKTWQQFINGTFDDYSLWICKLCSEPVQDRWTFWQYTHKGNVIGIEGEVDKNTFNGDYEAFIKYITRENESKDFIH